MSNVLRTETVAHRATRAAAERYIRSFANELGDVIDGDRKPVHIEWAVVPTAKGFDIVSTVSEQAAFTLGTVTCDDCGATHVAEYHHNGRPEWNDGDTRYFAVVCTEDDLTGYYAAFLVTPKEN